MEKTKTTITKIVKIERRDLIPNTSTRAAENNTGNTEMTVTRKVKFPKSLTIKAKEEEWKNVRQDWNWISKFSQSPENANYADIYASLGGSENALVDEICFAAGQQCPDP